MMEPTRPPGIRRLFRIGGTARAIRTDIDDEIRFHLEQRTADLIAGGMTPRDARAQAESEFGSVHESRRELARVARRRTRHQRREEYRMSLLDDLLASFRGLSRHRAFAALAIGTLTLGIAANAVMFGVIDQLLLKPPAGVGDPSGIRRVYYEHRDPDGQMNGSSTNAFRALAALRAQASGFAAVGGFFQTKLPTGQGVDAQQLDVRIVTGNYLTDILQAHPQKGRFFLPEEDVTPSGPTVAVISDGYWRRNFGAREDIVGQRLDISRKQFTIVGVAPANFVDIDHLKVDVWMPASAIATDLGGATWYSKPNWFWISTIARLKPGVTDSIASLQATAAYRNEIRTWRSPMDSLAWVALGPLAGTRTPNGYSPELKVSLWLVGVSLVVLLIACANVANLLIARTLRRRRELAVRLALGVSRGRLLRMLLLDAGALALIAAIASLIVAHWGGRLVEHALLPGIVWSDNPVDARVLAATLGAAILCMFLAGLAPALHGMRANVADGLKASSRQVAGGHTRGRNVLLAMQAGLSVVLLVGAGLFVKSLNSVLNRDVGIVLDRVVLAPMDLETAGFDTADVERAYRDAATRLRALPGVSSVSATAVTVPSRSAAAVSVLLPGQSRRPTMAGGGPYYGVVSGDFFATIGAPILRGRTFTPQESTSPSHVAVVSEPLAKAYWGNQNPIGTCVRTGNDSTCTTIVGVVGNVMLFSLVNDDRAMIYFPHGHPFGRGQHPDALLIRTTGDPAPIVPLIRSELQRLSPRMPYVHVQPYIDIVAPELRPWRLGASMFTIFGVFALIIAAVGLYSVIAYWVEQRTHEIGVRMALGAQRGDVVRLVALNASRPIVIGVALGLIAAALSARFVADMLYETSPHDVMVYAVAAILLLVSGVVASVIPARRAATVDPQIALRAD